jgi:hypothetical protein
MIIASAVKYSNGQIYVGKRHTDATMNAFNIMGPDEFGKKYNVLGEAGDGYITSSLRFIGRKEAYILAKSNGQFKRNEIQTICNIDNGYDGDELFSEDSW